MSAYEDLTELQRRFVDAYLTHGNASAAYRAAGYKARSGWNAHAARLIAKDSIQAALAERRAQLASANDVTPERVIAELALIGFSDLHAYVTWGPAGVTLRDSSTLDASARRAVSEVAQTISQGGGSLKFKLHSKTDALDKLARHLDLYGEQAALDQLGQGLLGLVTRTREQHTNGHHPLPEGA
jgi:phage terminase small subunit